MSFLAILFVPVVPLMLVLLPSRKARIIVTCHLGTVIGRTLMWISGATVTVEGREHFDGRTPAICIGNHTSITDAFTSIWLVPPGTVGVAKREILRYPFYGQIWLLSGHLVIDRTNTAKAKESMKEMAAFVREKGLSILLWPEGTRSRDGRLLPFKKGFVHLALDTGLPIVPMVISGAHEVWDRGSLRIREVPIHIKFLPPIDTSSWTLETVDDHTNEVWELIRDALPSEQRPLPNGHTDAE
jgi:1-acyl-sn-glycerol-3-phosphate acyltransferase